MEVTIERILPGGLGLAHAEAKTVMVRLAAPGDRLRVQVERVKGSVSFARILEVLTPSPQRVEPLCPYFGRCGGCDFQQLTYEAQLEAKADIIRDCLRRIGGIEQIPNFAVKPAPNPWHYRSRAQWQYDSVRKRFGYFESGSRRVCDVAECAVLVPELQQSLEFLRREMQEDKLPEEARDFRAVVGEDGVAISPGMRSPEGLGPPAPGDDVTRTIGGDTFRLNAESFFQTNADLLPQLIDAALRGAHGDTAIELYCGVGLFTLPLARRFQHVTGVESDAVASDFARENLTNAGLQNAQVANGDVAEWLAMNVERGDFSSASEKRRTIGEFEKPVDFLLLDPPRTGAESKVINGISKLRPQKICYVSCDPATLGRDLKKLIAGGYTLDSLAAFDMFPQTHHVETIAHLMLKT